MNKKAIIFSVDAILAVSVLLMIYIMSNTYFIKDNNKYSTNYLSYDLTSCFSVMTVEDVNNSYIASLIASGQINNTNSSLIEQIAEFYVLNQTELARNITQNLSQELIPTRFGFSFTVENDEIYTNNKTITGGVSTSKRMISGIEKFKPVRGSASKVYLEGILRKKFHTYTYFGGFVGQGNITVFNSEVPSDATIDSLYLEGVFMNNFTFLVNGEDCGKINASPNDLSPIAVNFASDCVDEISTGYNEFSVKFDGDLLKAYIAGGMIKIGYMTNQTSQTKNITSVRYYLPEIVGVINTYDSVYVPGTINNMTVYLHYNSTQSTYLNIGGNDVYQYEANGTIVTVNINDTLLKGLLNNYNGLSNTTVPVRMASYNLQKVLSNVSAADIVLVTDLSSSMKKNFDATKVGNNNYNCPTMLSEGSDSNYRRYLHARCLDNQFLDVLFVNASGARVWPIEMYESAISTYSNDPSSEFFVRSDVNNFNQPNNGYTCLSCAVNEAYNIFNTNNDSNRTRYIVFMTDGVPNYVPNDGVYGDNILYNSSATCLGYCDANGNCNNDPKEGCFDNKCDPAFESTRYAINRTITDFNVTVYTIGFGNLSGQCPNALTLLEDLADMSNGTFYESNDLEQLALIYKNIAFDILLRAEQTAQLVTNISNFTAGTLYGDSYVEFNITPSFTPPGFGEIELITQININQCNSTVTIPSEIRLIDGVLTSYSGIQWTQRLVVNNNETFNLDNFYNSLYYKIGDPFNVYIPEKQLVPGTNDLRLRLADSPTNFSTTCSGNNSFIYKGAIKASVSYSDVLEKVEGCNWTVEYDTGGFGHFAVPQDYDGGANCTYNSTCHSVITCPSAYDANDTYDDAIYRLFDQLDFDNDGRIFVNLDQNNLVINTILVSKVPYPWGPSIAEVRLWQ